MSFSGPIIDMHVHTAGIGAGDSGCFISPALRKNWRYNIYLSAFGVTQEELQHHGDGLILNKLSQLLTASQLMDGAVVLALDGVVRDGHLDMAQTEFYIPTEFIANNIKKHPELFYGASVNPYRRDALDRLEQAKYEGAVLNKWLPNIQGIRPDDPSIENFYAKLVELDLPLLSHVGEEHSFSHSDNSLAEPGRLELPLKMGVRVIAAHAGFSASRQGQKNFKNLLHMIPRFDNLCTDISSLTQINKHFALKKVLSAGINHRLLYGTDMPLINTALVSPWHYLTELPWKTFRKVTTYKNPWDRDVQLKRALGVPVEVFTRPAQYLKISYPVKLES